MAEEAEVKQEVKVDPYEEKARSEGWVSKEEWESNPDNSPEKWRPAKEFVERGELIAKISAVGSELKETKKALKMLQEHHTKVKESEYQRAVNELKEAQKKHLTDGNADEYLKTTEILTDLKAEKKAREVYDANAQPETDPRFTAWVEENKWYNQDQDMREFADSIGTGYAQRNPNLDPEDVLRYVTTQVKKNFREKFENQNRSKPTSVEGASASVTPKKSSFELTDEERRVMNTFVRTGVMTKEEFIDEVKKMRGV